MLGQAAAKCAARDCPARDAAALLEHSLNASSFIDGLVAITLLGNWDSLTSFYRAPLLTDVCAACRPAAPCYDEAPAGACSDGLMNTTGVYKGCAAARECDLCFPNSTCADLFSTAFRRMPTANAEG